MTSLALSARVRAAVDAVLEDHAEAMDADANVRAVRLEVRIKPDRSVRAVIFQQQSEVD